jgi:hypothetical protein
VITIPFETTTVFELLESIAATVFAALVCALELAVVLLFSGEDDEHAPSTKVPASPRITKYPLLIITPG